jgi:hypothetical protein
MQTKIIQSLTRLDYEEVVYCIATYNFEYLLKELSLEFKHKVLKSMEAYSEQQEAKFYCHSCNTKKK